MPKIIALSGHIGFDVTANFLRKELESAKNKPVRIDLNTPGGFVFEGIEIFNLIKEYPGNVEIRLMSLAASMGSYIALAGNKTVAFDNAVFMIHNAMTIAMGNQNEMRKVADRLEGISNLLAKAYIAKTGKSMHEIKEMMDDETFLFGNEMLDAGFVDEIIESNPEEKENDKKDRDNAITEARLSVENCFAKMRESEEAKNDLNKVAAYLDLELENEFDPEAPFPNEHACRIVDPSKFQKGSFRRIKSSGEGKKFDIIIGRLKGKTTTSTQAFRYPKTTWTVSEARKHCTDHDGILFEPASGHSGCSGCDKNKNASIREVNTMILKELLEQNPSAKIEYDYAIAEAEKTGGNQNEMRKMADRFEGISNLLAEVRNKKEKMQAELKKIAPIIASNEYPLAIRKLASEVLTGAEDYASLKGVITMHDAQKENQNSQAAGGEQGKETPPGQSPVISEDGSIKNRADYDAEIKRMKTEVA